MKNELQIVNVEDLEKDKDAFSGCDPNPIHIRNNPKGCGWRRILRAFFLYVEAVHAH